MLLSLPLSVGASVGATADAPFLFIDDQIAAHPGQSGVYVLDSGEEEQAGE